MSEYEHLDLERSRDERGNEVLLVTIRRRDNGPTAAINAVNGALHHDLTRLFAELRAEQQANCVVLTGAGPAFSAGGDFGWFPELADRGALERLRGDAKRLIYDLLDVPIPIVCAVNGHAVGLGASIALLCDTIFMARSATISDPHVKVGLVAGDGGTLIWPLAVGPAIAKRYLMTGDPISAEDASSMGLINEACADDAVLETAMAFARRLAAGAPLAIRYTKLAVNAAIKQQAIAAFDQAAAFEIATFGTDDHREALAAMSERRTPIFRGT